MSAIKWVLFLSILCISCRTVKYVPVELHTKETVTVRDTTVRVDLVTYRDSVSIEADSSYLSNPYAYSWARMSPGGVLNHSLVIKPGAFVEANLLSVEKTIEIEIGVPYEVIKEVSKPLNWWQKFIRGVGYVALGTILLGAIIFARKLLIVK